MAELCLQYLAEYELVSLDMAFCASGAMSVPPAEECLDNIA